MRYIIRARIVLHESPKLLLHFKNFRATSSANSISASTRESTTDCNHANGAESGNTTQNADKHRQGRDSCPPRDEYGRSTCRALRAGTPDQDKIPAPQCLSKNNQMTAGIHTKAAPPTGNNDRSAANTPNTTGDGRPANSKPIPSKNPCSKAVTVVPNRWRR